MGEQIVAKKVKEVTKEESKQILEQMADVEFKQSFLTFLKTRYPLFYVTTDEEKRFIAFLDHFCRYRGYECYLWDCYRGLIDLHTQEVVGGVDDSIKDPYNILDHIMNEGKSYINNRDAVEKKRTENVKGIVFVLLDYCRFIEENPDVERRLKCVTNMDSIVTTILTGPSYKSTDILENLIPVLDFPRPNKQEIKNALWMVTNSVSDKITCITKKTKKIEEDLINATSGLTLIEAQTAYSKSLVCHRGWNIPVILNEKRQIISKSGILDFYDSSVSMDDVGGLKVLTNWIHRRKHCFSKEAEEYGLEKPRGLLAIGMPGCGKSLVCKAIAGKWNMPLLRLDFGKLFDSLVGQSEQRARDALRLAEAISPCVLWIDEIEISFHVQ